jgi:hypothetical protein
MRPEQNLRPESPMDHGYQMATQVLDSLGRIGGLLTGGTDATPVIWGSRGVYCMRESLR